MPCESPRFSSARYIIASFTEKFDDHIKSKHSQPEPACPVGVAINRRALPPAEVDRA
jgi:hypothetical protein